MAMGADDVKDARGMAVADFDNDGDLDIVINNNPGDCGRESVPPVLLRNEVGTTRNFFVMELEGVESNRDAVGTLVKLEAESSDGSPPVRIMRHVHCGSGYASQGDMRLFFGLGDRERIDKLVVHWPSGKVQEFKDIKANRFVRLVEGGDLAEY